MQTILRRALETMDDKKIILSGPLSEVYTQALNQIYSKDLAAQEQQSSSAPVTEITPIEKSRSVATESQALVQAMINTLENNSINNTSVDEAEIQNDAVIYAVSQSEVSQDDIVNVAQKLNEHEDDNFILVVDATNTSDPDDSINEKVINTNPLAASLEALVLSHNKKVCHSFKECFESLK